MAVQGERDLRRSVLDSVQREMTLAQKYPADLKTSRDVSVDNLHIKPELMPELERMAGPQSYDLNAFPMSDDLVGQTTPRKPITLEQAVRSAVQNNLQVQFARLQPAIAESQVVAAQAAFDTTLFNNFEWSNLDQPRSQTRQGIQVFGTGADQRQNATNATGLRRALTSGGQLSVQQDLIYTDVTTPGQTQVPNPADELAWTLRLDQPLLRGFGSDVNLAQVRINRNLERDAIASLKRDLIKTVTDTERAYWDLVQSRYNLLVLQRLYERGVLVRDELVARGEIVRDASAAQLADARARVEQRRTLVIRSQNQFKLASDTLKALINDPELPVGGEDLIVPADAAIDAPITYNLADILLNAIRNRPEAQQAILSIDNTSIRQQVADNQRLPKLDLRLQTRFAGLDEDFGGAFDEALSGDFIDYLVGFQFEQPIGNRQAEAQYRQRRLERMQATIAYRNTIQQIVLEAKRSLRQVVVNYHLIEQTRITRVAETENLRSFEVERLILRGSTIEQRDLEFRRQDALAAAEQEEMAALINYNVALADLYASMGTALERNNIEFKVPDAEDALQAGGINSPSNPVIPANAPIPVVEPQGTPWKTPKKAPTSSPAPVPPAK
jgi:outer membrane protein TolC